MLLPVRHSMVQCGPSAAAMPARLTCQVQKIGKRHDSYRLAGADDNQAPDRMTSHQVGSLVDGGLGRNSDDGRRHEVGDDGSPRFIPSFRAPLEVAGGQHANQFAIFFDEQVMDAAAAHVLTGGGRRSPWSDDLYASSHDFRDWCHATWQGNSDARSVKAASGRPAAEFHVSHTTERPASDARGGSMPVPAKKSACRACFHMP